MSSHSPRQARFTDSPPTNDGVGLLVDSGDSSAEIPSVEGPKSPILVPTLGFHQVDYERKSHEDISAHSPPTSPSQELLDGSDTPRVQFAGYPHEEKSYAWGTPKKEAINEGERWIPLPLRTRFWVPFLLALTIGAIGLEIALHFSTKNQGWPVNGDFNSTAGFMHYVYTLPPVIVAMVAVAMWTWTDIEIKKMQPYVDLVHGDSPPHRSLLLDYTRTNNFVVWTLAAANRHYLVALTTLMVLVSLSLQPLAAALLTVRDTWIAHPDVTLNNQFAIGLNQNPQFQDLTSFLTAAGYASATVLYHLADPPFIHGQYTVGPFQLPTDIVSNGTVIANTSAILSDPGCKSVQTNMTLDADGQGWTTNVTGNGCTGSFHVNKNTTNFFGVNVVDCPAYANTPPQFLPVIFWFFTYQPSPTASATFCFPTIQLFDVNVNVDLASGNLTQVTQLGPFGAASNFSSLSANVSGSPLNGRAYNGIQFDLTDPDIFVLQRLNATQLALPAAVFQAAESNPEGLEAIFNTDQFVQLSTQVYTTYLKLIAKTVYFLPFDEPLTMQVKTFQKRLWLSSVATHLLAFAMLLLALCGIIIHVFHRNERRHLFLAHQPGTIASAVSIGAQTNVGQLLAGRQRTEDINAALQDKKFRIDVRTMKVVMEGEEGYDFAASPVERRRSIFEALQAQRRLSKRSSKAPRTPTMAADSEA